jgi:hypothetical protein
MRNWSITTHPACTCAKWISTDHRGRFTFSNSCKHGVNWFGERMPTMLDYPASVTDILQDKCSSADSYSSRSRRILDSPRSSWKLLGRVANTFRSALGISSARSDMPKCVACGADTRLHLKCVSLCEKCADAFEMASNLFPMPKASRARRLAAGASSSRSELRESIGDPNRTR